MSSLDAKAYYMVYQITASVVVGLLAILLGFFIAWIVWGRKRHKTIKLKQENKRLRDEWLASKA